VHKITWCGPSQMGCSPECSFQYDSVRTRFPVEFKIRESQVQVLARLCCHVVVFLGALVLG
jgi:hypothetical protein